MLSPITVDGKELRCKHAKTWPPGWSKLGKSSDEVRYRFSDEEYERAKTWERVCGLKEMNPIKCPSCPFVLCNGAPLVETTKFVPSVTLFAKAAPRRKKA